MSGHDTREPLWDMFIIEVEVGGQSRVCLLAFSGAGQAFVERKRGYMGEAFGNGLLLTEAEATIAFDALDSQGLIARPL